MRIQELVIVNNGTADARARLVRVAVLVSGTGLVDVRQVLGYHLLNRVAAAERADEPVLFERVFLLLHRVLDDFALPR